MPRLRLDVLLAERGLFPSRSRAAASVMAGEVQLGASRRRAFKPGEMVAADEVVAVLAGRDYASRGGIKLANALEGISLEVAGRRALDVGSSTGGFTDCLLQRGAREVIAVDVGYGLLDYRLREDPRVLVMERTNARELSAELLPPSASGAPGLPDLATVDVSFISLAKVLPAVVGSLEDRFDVLALIKPQFELGRGRVPRGGVVRDPELRRETLVSVGACAVGLGLAVRGYRSSGLPGPKGNRETFVWLKPRTPGQEPQGPERLEEMAREVEP